MERKHIFVGAIAVAIALVLGWTQAQGLGTPEDVRAPAAPLGTGFTYQGRLEKGGRPVDQDCEMIFRLYEQASGDNQVGDPFVDTVPVVDGLFTAYLDFGDAFAGSARWLGIEVRCPDDDGFIDLGHQELTAAPYALYALKAPWSGLTDVPDGLEDGDDVVTYTAGTGLSLTGREFSVVTDTVQLRVGQSCPTSYAIRQIEADGSVACEAVGEGASGNNHDHLGQTWIGDDNALVITGSFRLPNSAPLVLGNSDLFGNGLYIMSAGLDGVKVHGAGSDGLEVDAATFDGVRVDAAGDDGVEVVSADENGLQVSSASRDGVYVASAGDDGVHVGNAGGDGIYVNSAGRYAGYFGGDVKVTGDLTVTGNLVNGGRSFRIDHPLDPENRYLTHSAVESSDMMNVYSGNVILGGDGQAWVELPDWFEALNRDFRYQLTPIGGPGPNLYVAKEIEDHRFKIAGGEPGMKVSWQVTGVRHDPYAERNRTPVEGEKAPGERGSYLHPEAYGLSPTER